MGFGSPIHWIILGIIAIVLFGGGRFPSMMGDVAKGIKSFKKGMDDDHDAPAGEPDRPAPRLQQQPPVEPAPPVVDRDLRPVRDDRPHE